MAENLSSRPAAAKKKSAMRSVRHRNRNDDGSLARSWEPQAGPQLTRPASNVSFKPVAISPLGATAPVSYRETPPLFRPNPFPGGTDHCGAVPPNPVSQEVTQKPRKD